MARKECKWRLRVGLIVADPTGERISELDEIAARIGAHTVKRWTKGSRFSDRVGDERTYKDTGFRIDVFDGDDGDPESHVKVVLSKVARDGIAAALRRFCCQVTITLKIYSDETPALNFSESTITALAAFGSSLDVDIYVRQH